jgi:hypothetical protein
VRSRQLGVARRLPDLRGKVVSGIRLSLAAGLKNKTHPLSMTDGGSKEQDPPYLNMRSSFVTGSK